MTIGNTDIGYIGSGQISNTQGTNVAEHQKNSELGQVKKASIWALAGRITLGVLTLGVSEGIRAIVHAVNSRAPAEPRINRPVVKQMETKLYTAESIKEGVVDAIDRKLKTKLSEFEKQSMNMFDLEGDINKINNSVKNGKISPKKQFALQSKSRRDYIKNMVAVLNHIERLDLSKEAKDLIRKEAISKHSITSVKELDALLKIGSKNYFSEVSNSLKNNEGITDICSDFIYATEDAMTEVAELMTQLGLAKNAEAMNLNMMNSKLFVIMQAVEHNNPEIKAFADSFKNNPEKLKEYDKETDELSRGIKHESGLSREQQQSLEVACSRFSEYLLCTSNYEKSCRTFSGIDSSVPFS